MKEINIAANVIGNMQFRLGEMYGLLRKTKGELSLLEEDDPVRKNGQELCDELSNRILKYLDENFTVRP